MTPDPRTVLTMINSPGEFFDHPSKVANHPGLRRSDRIDILRSWKHDAMLLMKGADANRVKAYSYSLEDIDKALSSEISEEG